MLDYGMVSDLTNGLTLMDACKIQSGVAYIPIICDEGKDQRFAFLAIFMSIHGRCHHVAQEFYKVLKLFVKYWASFKKGFTVLWEVLPGYCESGLVFSYEDAMVV